MALDNSKRPPVDFTFHSLTLPVTRTGTYGLKFQGDAPVMIASVTRGSSADKAGVKAGDFVIALNGNDLQASMEEAVLTIIKYSHGAVLDMRVGRPQPLPVTDFERRKAIITLQTKLLSGDYVTAGDEVQKYKSTINNALSEVGDILGDFGVPDQRVPDAGGTVQEVELTYYDSDSLSNPPSSSGEESDKYDSFLDFTRDDEFDHRPGTDLSGASMAESVRQAQQALREMKELMKETTEAKEKKRLSKERGNNKASVRTDATFTPGYSPVEVHQTRTQPSVVDRQQNTKKDRDSLEDYPQIQWTESPLARGGGMVGGHVTAGDGRSQPPKAETQRERSKSPPGGWIQPGKAEKQRENSRSKSPPGGGMVGGHVTTGDGRSQPPKAETRREKSKSPPGEWVQPGKAEKQRAKSKSPPGGWVQPGKTETQRAKSKSPPPRLTKGGSKETSPPPIPSYNPSDPDSFLLSNRPAYKDERRKETHTYESVSKEQVVEATGRPSGRGQRTRDLPSPPGQSQGMSIPIRNKKKVSDKLPSYEPGGYVEEDVRRRGNKQSFEPVPRDVSTSSSSCSGLPMNLHDWKKGEVSQWMKQLSTSLYAHYFPLFSKHDITGRTLLRLDAAKLKKMGITNAVHCRILATEIAKLKIQQELTELEELEESALSYL